MACETPPGNETKGTLVSKLNVFLTKMVRPFAVAVMTLIASSVLLLVGTPAAGAQETATDGLNPTTPEVVTLIPLDPNMVDTGFYGNSFETKEFKRASVPQELQGRTCDVYPESLNGESNREDVNMIFTSGGASVTLENVESKSYEHKEGEGKLVLGDEIIVSVRFGGGGVFSGGIAIEAICNPPVPVPPTTPAAICNSVEGGVLLEVGSTLSVYRATIVGENFTGYRVLNAENGQLVTTGDGNVIEYSINPGTYVVEIRNLEGNFVGGFAACSFSIPAPVVGPPAPPAPPTPPTTVVVSCPNSVLNPVSGNCELPFTGMHDYYFGLTAQTWLVIAVLGIIIGLLAQVAARFIRTPQISAAQM